MRKFLIAAIAFIGIITASQAAHAVCAPANPFAPYANPCLGPRFGSVNGYVINGPGASMPYAQSYNCGYGPCLYGQVGYNPPVPGAYYGAGGYGMMQGGVQGASIRVRQYRRVSVRSYTVHTQMCQAWRMVDGVKVYTEEKHPCDG